MTKKARTILFLICLALFILTAPTIILYSQGYRVDIDSKKITQTGGLFLKVIPKQVEVFIDGKLKKKTDFFFGSALIENLLPRKYKIEIKKEGYELWEKNLEVKEKEVIEVKNIVLIPKNQNFSILTENAKEFWFSPDEKKIILLEEDKSSSPPSLLLRKSSVSEKTETGWALKLYDLERNVKSHLVDEYSFISTSRYARVIDEKDIYSKGADLLELEFSSDSKEIFLEVGVEEQLKYFTLEIDKVPPVLTERKIASTPEDIVTSQVFNGENYYLDNSGHLFKNPSIAKGEDERKFIDYGEKITEKPFPIKAETEYKLNIFPENIFLWENKTLYLFSPNSKSFEKFFENASLLTISPDNKKLVLISDYEIWILFLKEIANQPQRKAGEQLFLVRLSEKIGDCFWLNSDYLIFNAANKIKIAEIDDRDKTNIVDVAEFESPEIFWNQFDKKLYILSGNNLSQSEKLLP